MQHTQKHLTVRDAIGSLPRISAGEANENDRLHISPALSPINLERIQHSVPGGTWRDWPERLVLNCHKKRGGKTYASVYGRMKWDDLSPTITTQFIGYGTGRFWTSRTGQGDYFTGRRYFTVFSS